MANGAWVALSAAVALVAADAASRGSVNRRMPSIKRGDRVAYNPRWVERRPLAPGDKADALKARGTVVDASGALVNVRWDGSQDMLTYGYPNEIVLEQALAKTAKAVQHRLPDTFDDMTLADRGGTLLTPKGEVKIKKIGQGMFATVYRDLSNSDRVFAFVSEGAYEKEILSDAHRSLPKNPHIPAVERFGTLMDGRMVYAMPFYAAPYRKGNAKPADHEAFNKIKKCVSSLYSRHRQTPYELMSRKVECIEEAGVPASILEAISELRDASSNYGDTFDMEFSPRNVATDADGNLILLDLLYDRDGVLRKRQQARRKRGVRW